MHSACTAVFTQSFHTWLRRVKHLYSQTQHPRYQLDARVRKKSLLNSSYTTVRNYPGELWSKTQTGYTTWPNNPSLWEWVFFWQSQNHRLTLSRKMKHSRDASMASQSNTYTELSNFPLNLSEPSVISKAPTSSKLSRFIVSPSSSTPWAQLANIFNLLPFLPWQHLSYTTPSHYSCSYHSNAGPHHVLPGLKLPYALCLLSPFSNPSITTQAPGVVPTACQHPTPSPLHENILHLFEKAPSSLISRILSRIFQVSGQVGTKYSS